MSDIKRIFYEKFGREADSFYFSPGRVNIIGEHTDYNGGQVLPFCINLGIYAAVRFREDTNVLIYSDNFSNLGIIEFSLDNLDFRIERDFANYACGILREFGKRGFSIKSGFELAIYSDLPVGGGLSSSAAFLDLIGKIVIDRFGFDLSNTDLAWMSKTTENEYIGVSCGIMDQFIIANGKKGNAIRLHTDTMDYEYVPIPETDFQFILINSNVTRKLTESKYNERQRETQAILRELQKHVPINNICDLAPEDYKIYERYLFGMNLKRRLLHLLNENHRVTETIFAIAENDYTSLGQLINESHESLKNLYQVSSEKLDELVDLGRKAGSLGSRMIGGGFGGSTLNVVLRQDIETFIQRFTEMYQKEYNQDPIIYLVEATDGVRKIND